jgi:hypothetical protein
MTSRFSFKLNTQVYVLADRLQINSLKQEALTRCTRCLQQEQRHEVRELLEEAFLFTRFNDEGLRDTVLRFYFQHRKTISLSSATKDLLKAQYGVAWTLLIDLTEQAELDKQNLQANSESQLLKRLVLDSSSIIIDKKVILALISGFATGLVIRVLARWFLAGNWIVSGDHYSSCVSEFSSKGVRQKWHIV